MSKVKVYSDGGARGNPGPAAIGVLVCDQEDEEIESLHRTIGDATNNVAEYSAVIAGLELAQKLKATEVDYYLDSELVCFQIIGKYRVKTPHLLDYYKRAKALEKTFKKVTFQHVPRTHERIRYVDRLVNQALDMART